MKKPATKVDPGKGKESPRVWQ